MTVAKFGDDMALIDILVEGHQVGLFFVQTLQDIHIVGQGALCCSAVGEPIIPTGPGPFSPGQMGYIGVQYHLVVGELELREDPALIVAGLLQDGQRLITMTGEHNLVKSGDFFVALHIDAIRGSLYTCDRSV